MYLCTYVRSTERRLPASTLEGSARVADSRNPRSIAPSSWNPRYFLILQLLHPDGLVCTYILTSDLGASI